MAATHFFRFPFPLGTVLVVIFLASFTNTFASPVLENLEPHSSWITDEDNYNLTRFRRQTTTPICPKGKWKCRSNNQCIDSVMVCDGNVDCSDKSDETQATCIRVRCRPHLFRCTYGACVDGDAKCDGKQDCADNSDELHKDCKKTPVVNTCKGREFQCTNGNCIASTLVCDGEDNCPDKSDETVAQCSSFKCRSNLFRCAYGACVDGDAQCNNIKECSDGSDEHPDLCSQRPGWIPLIIAPVTPVPPPVTPAPSNGCAMPPIPENGKYTIGGKVPTTPPGSITPPYTYLEYSCNKGYAVDGLGVSYCTDENQWSNSPLCLKKCDPVVSVTTDLTCLDTANKAIPCGEQLPHGSTVTAKCKPQHFPRFGRLNTLTCNRGNWDFPSPRCDPECGSEKSQGLAYIIGGFKVKRGGFPWHVGIFDQHDIESPPTQICGGTIIANTKIITAAHCFYDTDNGKVEDAKHYWIGAGKLYRDWDNEADKALPYVQFSKVKEIHVPTQYGGDEQNQQSDIAVIILEKPLLFSDSVHAACLDLTNGEFDTSQTAAQKIGKASGWGLTTEGGQPSEILKAIVLPVIDYNSCRNDMPKSFRKYLTTDKFCAGYKDNGTSLCRGDSGGGFMVNSLVQESERWYLRGIVSVGPLNDEATSCRSNSYTAFTHVYKMSSFLLDVISD